MTRLAAAVLATLLLPPAGPALAQQVVGVELSSRERAVAVPVRLPDGRVALRPPNSGLPWLFGLGDVYGKASAVPLVNGVTPSVLASTPSGGLVPGQDPE